MADTKPKAVTKESLGSLVPPSNVSVHEFTEAVFTGVLRAIDARQIKGPGTITYGIIYDPTTGEAMAKELE